MNILSYTLSVTVTLYLVSCSKGEMERQGRCRPSRSPAGACRRLRVLLVPAGAAGTANVHLFPMDRYLKIFCLSQIRLAESLTPLAIIGDISATMCGS